MDFLWWRRRESNPRPKIATQEHLHAWSMVSISRNYRSIDKPLISPALLYFVPWSSAVHRTIPLLRRFIPDEWAHQRETDYLFRQPLRTNNRLQLKFVRPFYEARSEPRHAVQVSHIPVETRSPPLLYYNIAIKCIFVNSNRLVRFFSALSVIIKPKADCRKL